MYCLRVCLLGFIVSILFYCLVALDSEGQDPGDPLDILKFYENDGNAIRKHEGWVLYSIMVFPLRLQNWMILRIAMVMVVVLRVLVRHLVSREH